MNMRENKLGFGLLCLLAAALPLAGATRTQARLLLASEVVKPGETVLAGVLLRMPPPWHTYWRYGGDSGAPTKVEWQLPPGVTTGEIQWPVPEKLTMEGLTTYVYHDEVLLLVPVMVAKDAAPGRKELKAKVSWLECAEVCVPGKAEVQAAFEVGTTSTPSPDALLFETWRARLPRVDPALAVTGLWEKQADRDPRPLILEVSRNDVEDFFPFAADNFEVQAATEKLSSEGGKGRLRKRVKNLEGDWPAKIAGVLIAKADNATIGYEVQVLIGKASGGANPVAVSTAAGNPGARVAVAEQFTAAAKKSLWLILFSAFMGGLILNIMPCVLPVIALKILGFVNQSQEAPRQVRKLGLIYGIGVLASFLVLAGVVVAVKTAGHKASWGMQFGNPIFIIALTILVTLVALNLFGVFEVTLSGKLMGAAGDLAGKEGAPGAFFNGVLATALATPCTAPFLGAALGFAFAEPPAIIVLTFLTVGLGLAMPYVVLSLNPAWLKFLPKSGAWMEKFKIAMGFPMLATAVWLFTLTPLHYGKRVLWLGLFLVVIALAAWIYGEFVQRGRKRRGLAGAIAAAILAGGYAYAMEDQLHWRSPQKPVSNATLAETPEGIQWQAWSPEAVQKARAEGRPVFVDFTADWCVTCQANKKTSIEIPSVRAKLREINAVPLLGDYTAVPDNITDELNRFHRAGVPLVLVYPREASKPPIVLPELLRPGIVLDALTKAAQ